MRVGTLFILPILLLLLGCEGEKPTKPEEPLVEIRGMIWVDIETKRSVAEVILEAFEGYFMIDEIKVRELGGRRRVIGWKELQDEGLLKPEKPKEFTFKVMPKEWLYSGYRVEIIGSRVELIDEEVERVSDYFKRDTLPTIIYDPRCVYYFDGREVSPPWNR